MVAKEVSVNVKIKIIQNMNTSQISCFFWKMHNLLTIETPKNSKYG